MNTMQRAFHLACILNATHPTGPIRTAAYGLLIETPSQDGVFRIILKTEEGKEIDLAYTYPPVEIEAKVKSLLAVFSRMVVLAVRMERARDAGQLDTVMSILMEMVDKE